MIPIIPPSPPKIDNGDDLASNLTKREQFALHAPTEIPDWFIDNWLEKYFDDEVEGGSYDLVSSSRGTSVDYKTMMKVLKAWRYAFADMMLEEE